MKKNERYIYHQLADLKFWGLCNFCRYSVFTGSACDDGDLECHCGIYDIEEVSYDVWAGDDCWMFKPRYKLEDIVDMVGLWLQGNSVDMSNCKDYTPEKVKSFL